MDGGLPKIVGDRLTNKDTHYWTPVPRVVNWLCDNIPPGARILEIGPGVSPFPRAQTCVDFIDIENPPPGGAYKCDLTRERLPFEDKSFEFVYCRHLLEDSWNPFAICEEMSRVGKMGYIETPSPLAEMARGVDGNSVECRGYHHHRFFVWEYAGQLKFVTKYPLVEYFQGDETQLYRKLREGPKYWNTHYLWSDRIVMNHVQSPLHFNVGNDYATVIAKALNESGASIDWFWKLMEE